MEEGDRDFTGIMENINNITQKAGVPVMVKEVGFGMTGNTARILADLGVEGLDIGGYGGTNFAKIESMRRNDGWGQMMDTIGIPTPVSLADVCKVQPGIHIICGGGIRSGLDITKALIIGADAVSIAYPLLKAYKAGGDAEISREIERFIYELKVSMVSSGAGRIDELHGKKIIFTGSTLEWINQM
jgi:isopentenyl-diphosphate delta-isomerase